VIMDRRGHTPQSLRWSHCIRADAPTCAPSRGRLGTAARRSWRATVEQAVAASVTQDARRSERRPVARRRDRLVRRRQRRPLADARPTV